MLFEYMKRTLLFLNDQAFARFNDADVVRWVNVARGQIAATAQCVRSIGTLAVTSASQVYNFTSIAGLASGIAGVTNVQTVTFNVATGQKWVHTRSWPYFRYYFLSQPAPSGGPPSAWSQYGEGASGSLYVNLLDAAYVLNCDCTGYPSPLTLDTDTEALPYTWQDAVPLYAAYLAAMTAEDMERAEKFWAEYQKFDSAARVGATPSVLPGSFKHAPDQFEQNRLGLQVNR